MHYYARVIIWDDADAELYDEVVRMTGPMPRAGEHIVVEKGGNESKIKTVTHYGASASPGHYSVMIEAYE